ncbi:hypothetical protein [Flexithrix dorotheae]|uniref:hypothetical protein n=1 Tax=Flexithrix dorotheae TaxID=70993 RepID=UPI0003629D81|nr:hypothetical protein [Flexithrix dorotheae]
MKQQNNFEFKYNGENHSIDINTLLTSQFHYAAILTEIKTILNPDSDLKITVQSFQKGSFEINQLIEIGVITGSVLFQHQPTINSVFIYFKAIIDIKKLLGNKEPDEIIDLSDGKIQISVNGNDNVLIVDKEAFNIYKNNAIINGAIANGFKALENDEEVKGIEINNKTTNKKILDINRNDFKKLANDENPFLDDNKNTKVRVDPEAVLYIKKLDISTKKNAKWSFIYEGRKINGVAVKDEKFLSDVINGLKFGNGDRLVAKLKITQKKDLPTGAFLDYKYEITEVIKVVPKSKQGKLF